MSNNMDNNLHHPPHLFVDDSWYFITAHTFGDHYHLKKEILKKNFISKLHDLSIKMKIKIHAFVVLDNHYHVLSYFTESNLIPKFINLLHGSTSHYINKTENRPGRKIWYSYWDRIIRDEAEFWTKYNYIHYNPVKHGYVKDPEQWEYSTYRNHLNSYGEEWMMDCWQTYPVVEYDFER